jgi:8-oxo-dGTP pyrophosphatase MutT (NUDIX family)
VTSDVNDFANSYLGKLRQKIGHDLVHVPGAGILIENSQGRIPFHQRSDTGIWDTPGGAPENNENAVQHAIREVYEETGLRVLNPIPFAFASEPKTSIISYPNGDICHFHDLLFYATEYEGTLIDNNEETLAVGWFEPTNLPEVKPISVLAIAALLEFKKTGVFQMI